jgi:hypothetical protein
MTTPSVRANVITRRTYSRPLEDGTFETWNDTVNRVIYHQSWLWKRAKGADLNEAEMEELAELRELMLQRKVLPSGRALWLGGTPTGQTRESSLFNCSFLRVATVGDAVDAMWLLLQGCGVGFEPVTGTLSGFAKPVRVTTVRSRGETAKGYERNRVKEYTANHLRVWHLTIGDSAEAWAKSIGKLLAFKGRVDEIVLDFSEIRAAGIRLKGYGWISSGDETLCKALEAICGILNRRADALLTRIDILDLLNWLGTTLSSRRSAEIALVPYGDPEWQAFATAKKDHWVSNPQRAQSNNSLVFHQKPHIGDLYDIFSKIEDGGGSEPGFINAQAALKRAPWFKGVNPCGEIALADRSFCNLVEVDIAKFNSMFTLCRAMRLAARMNYRQTCVNLKDGILQDTWNETNEFLRLCGVGITGVVRWLSGDEEKDAVRLQMLRTAARDGAFSMADVLNMPRPKAVTTVKPSGCRPWYALTSTTDGILTLEELLADHEDGQDWSDYTGTARVLQGDETKAITKTYVNGVAPLYRITMSHGLTVESTGNHPWWVSQRYDRSVSGREKYKDVSAWTQTQDIRPGDILEVSLGVYQKTEHAKLRRLHTVALKMRGDCTEILQPAEMNEDLAWLFGYLWGDGAMSPLKYRIRFIDQRRAHLEKAQRILREQFGLAVEVVRASQKRDAWCIDAASKHLWFWLIKNGVFKYDTDGLEFIPRVVRASSRDDIIAFMAGLLDADGCVSTCKERKRQVMLTSADGRFARHFQDVSWSVGLGFGMSHNTLGQNLQKRKSMYISTLSGYADADAFEALVRNCEKIKASDNDRPFTHELASSNRSIVGKVASVEIVGDVPTYDIEVADNHWFYAGAVKSHNTLSKIMDTTEGCHAPLGRFIFNNVRFSAHDPAVAALRAAGYRTFADPYSTDAVLVTLPVEWAEVPFEVKDGVPVNLESALAQLARYKLLMDNYVDHNCSITVSYSLEEVPGIVRWIDANWDHYVGVSFIYRNDPTKTAQDLGYPYIPQEVVDEKTFRDYTAGLQPVVLDGYQDEDELVAGDGCATGACPIR